MTEEVAINQLSKEWRWVRLEEIGRTETGTTPSKGNSEYYGKEIPFFKPSDLDQGINTNLSLDGLSKLGFEKARKLSKNSILVTCIGATIGKTGLIRVDGACNQQINSITPYAFHDPKFIFFQIISNKFQRQIKDNASSTTLPILNKSKFNKLRFITTGLGEQKAIVSKIEQLFSELDKGIENLRLAQQQLKTYRQAVLKWAFQGRLTNENVKEGMIPKDWEKKTLDDVAKMCLGKMLDKEKNRGEYHPYLRNISVRWGSFDLESLERMRFEEDEEERYGLKNGDLIVCEGGEPGRCAIWKNEIPNMKIQKALHRVRVDATVSVNYLYYFMAYAGKSGLLESYFTGTTIKHLTGTQLRKIEIPVPSIKEQLYIIQQIESRLSGADKLEETLTQSLQRAEALRQSILKQAFEGKLV